MAIDVVIGEVACKITDDRVKRFGAEKLKSMLPMLRVHQLGVGDNLNGERFKRLVQLAEPLLLPLSHQAVELVDGIGIVGNFVNVVMKGFGVLEVEGKGVILVVEVGKKVIPLHAEFPGRPSYVWIVHVEVTVGRNEWIMVVIRGSRCRRECPV
jgi:hypothetical protein